VTFPDISQQQQQQPATAVTMNVVNVEQQSRCTCSKCNEPAN
jgi:hypothetical protein